MKSDIRRLIETEIIEQMFNRPTQQEKEAGITNLVNKIHAMYTGVNHEQN